MSEFELNALGQPVGLCVEGWSPPLKPSREPMPGRYCRLEALDPERHAQALHAANRLDAEGCNWTYLAYGPFEQASGEAVGLASYLRITPEAGSIEVGHLAFSPRLQRRPAATEAMFLMMQRAFELGYRRYEWKCNALNTPSRAAAQRLGFSYEGIFRQALVSRGRNRDTAWFSIIDAEWPPLKAAFERWLAPENFDAEGRQRVALSTLTAPILKQRG